MAACAIAAAPGDIGGVARPSESASASEGLSESAEDRSAALAAGIAQSSCCAAALSRPSASSARRCADTTSRHCQPHQVRLAGHHGAHRLVLEAPFEGGVLPSERGRGGGHGSMSGASWGSRSSSSTPRAARMYARDAWPPERGAARRSPPRTRRMAPPARSAPAHSPLRSHGNGRNPICAALPCAACLSRIPPSSLPRARIAGAPSTSARPRSAS